MPESAAHHPDPRPAEWVDLLSVEEWRIVEDALGVERVPELLPMLSAVTPAFRRRLVGHLQDLDGYPSGRKLLLAVAQCTHELLDSRAATDRQAQEVGA